MRRDDQRIALSMAQLDKLADKGDGPLSPADFRRIVRCGSGAPLLHEGCTFERLTPRPPRPARPPKK